MLQSAPPKGAVLLRSLQNSTKRAAPKEELRPHRGVLVPSSSARCLKPPPTRWFHSPTRRIPKASLTESERTQWSVGRWCGVFVRDGEGSPETLRFIKEQRKPETFLFLGINLQFNAIRTKHSSPPIGLASYHPSSPFGSRTPGRTPLAGRLGGGLQVVVFTGRSALERTQMLQQTSFYISQTPSDSIRTSPRLHPEVRRARSGTLHRENR